MARKSTKTATDPELTRQMRAASAAGDDVEAVFTLAPDNATEGVPSPEETEDLTQRLLKRVTSRVGQSEKKLNIFRNIGSFVVSAHPAFVKELIEQPEVATAIANRQPEPVSSEPIKKRQRSSAKRSSRPRKKPSEKE